MKSFTSIVLIAASATIASAQVTYNSTTGVFTCPASSPNGAFCASDSLQGNIIIRCTNGIGQPGNCNDNLAGEPPFGVNYSPCWETSNTSGDAACSKNCIVYGGPGNGTFTLPNCTPISSTSSSSSSSTSSTSASSTSTVSTTASSSSSTSSSSSGTTSGTTSVSTTGTTSGSATTTSTTITATVTTVCTTGTTTFTSTYTTTYCPSSTLSTIALPTGGSTASSNGTISTSAPGGSTTPGSTPTATPVGPTTSSSPSFTNAAVVNSGSILAGFGLVIAYFL